jgi:hypothetical protein
MDGQRDIGRSWKKKSEPEVADLFAPSRLKIPGRFPRLKARDVILGILEPTKIPETGLLAKRAVIMD